MLMLYLCIIMPSLFYFLLNSYVDKSLTVYDLRLGMMLAFGRVCPYV